MFRISVLVLVGGTETALAFKKQISLASSPRTFVYSKCERFSVRRFPRSSRLHAKSRHSQWQLIYSSELWYDIFNCNWVDTRWPQYNTHSQTDNT